MKKGKNNGFIFIVMAASVLMTGIDMLYGQSGLIMEATFNEAGADAETPDGRKIPADIKPLENGSFSFEEGVEGKAIRLTRAGLNYPALDNINPPNGSLSFWIKPVDWGPGADEKKDAPVFVCLWSFRPDAEGYHLYYHHAHKTSTISFYSRVGEKNFAISDQKAEAMKTGEWTHMVITWSDWELRLYINGKEAGYLTYGLPHNYHPKIASHHVMQFLPTYYYGGERRQDTLLDEIAIFNTPLNGDEVNSLYLRYRSKHEKDIRQSVLPVPLSTSDVKLDGILNRDEWAGASRVPIMKRVNTHYLTDVEAWVHLKHDNRYLFAGYEISYEGELTTYGQGRIGTEIFKGDEVEILIKLPGDSKTDYCQFAVAPNGSYAYRDRTGNWKWQCGFKHAVNSEENLWTAEMAIPLKELGIDPLETTAIEVNMGMHRPSDARLGGAFERWLSWSSVPGKSAFSETMGTLLLRQDDTAVRINRLGKNILYGRLNSIMESPAERNLRFYLNVLPGNEKETAITKEIYLEGSKQLQEKIPFMKEGLLSIKGYSEKNNDLLFDYSSLIYIKEPFDFSFVCHSDRREIGIDVDMRGLEERHSLDMKEGRVVLTAIIEEGESKKIYGLKEERAETFSTKMTVPFKEELPVGKYNVRLGLTAGSEKYKKQQIFERPSPVFLQDRKGLERYVPAPWTEIKKEADTVRTRYHRYRFGGNPFPEKAWSQDIPVLSNTTIIVKTAGKEYQLTPVSSREIEVSPDRIITEGVHRSNEANLEMTWRRRIDYDGLVRVNFSLSPVKGSVQIDSFSVESEVPEQTSSYALTPTYNHEWTEKGKTVLNTFPTAWLTNDTVGFCVLTDTDANWVYPPGRKPIHMLKQEGASVIQAEIISTPVILDTKADYLLAVMATPGKLPRKDWRKIHAEGYGLPGQTLQITGWSHEKGMWWVSQSVLTELLYPEEARKILDRYRKKGVGCVPYALANQLATNNPISDYYGSVWQRTQSGRHLAPSYRTEYQGKVFYLGTACPASGFADYLTYYIGRAMREYGFKGIYLDGGGPGFCDNARHGCRRIDVFDKDRFPESYNTFALREMYERLYKIIHTNEPGGYLYVHMWDLFSPPVMSFVDVTNPGEEFMHVVPRDYNYYVDSIPPERWQSSYRSPVIGSAVQFLAMIQRGYPLFQMMREKKDEERMRLTRPLLTACLLHDIPLSGGMYVPAEVIWEILDRNNINDAKFHPYWRQKEISAEGKDILISYYGWGGEKRRLVITGNWSAENTSFSLRLNDLKGKKVTAVNEETGKETDISLPVEVPARNFRIYSILWE